MILEFEGKMIYWRGPAPWFFVRVPPEESGHIKAIANQVTYGWGVIPVQARIGDTSWTTSLFPKDGLYLVPVKAHIRKAENLDEGDDVMVELIIEE